MKNTHWALLAILVLGLILWPLFKRRTAPPAEVAPQSRAEENEAPATAPAEPAHPVAMPAPVAAVAKIPPENPANSQDPKIIQALIQKVQASIPTKADLRKLTPEQAHFTPPAVQQAGLAMGELAEALTKNPAWIPEGLRFYESCSLDQEYPSSIRALCYGDLQKRLQQTGKNLSSFAGDRDVPDAIKVLAKKIQ